MPFIYTSTPNNDETSYWDRRAKERSAENLAKAIKPVTFAETMEARKEQLKQEQLAQRRAVETSGYAWHGEGLQMTPAQHAIWKQRYFDELNKEYEELQAALHAQPEETPQE